MNINDKPMIETHGKVEDKFQPQLLEQVWGSDNLSRYGTVDVGTYTRKVHGMTRSDLEAHARQMGVVIVEHSPRLCDKLISEFKSYIAMTQKPITAATKSQEVSDAVKKILMEGR